MLRLRDSIDWATRWLPTAILVLGTGSAALIAYEIDERADRQAAAKFQIETERASTLVSLQAGRLEQLLRGTAAFLATAGNVRAGAFHTYVDSVELAERFPGVRAIAFAQRIPPEAEGGLSNDLARDLARTQLSEPRFEAWPETDGGVTDRGVRSPAALVEPQAGNDRLFGYDLWTDPDRRAAAWRAIDTGQMHASAPVVLSEDAGQGRVSQLVLMPVIRPADLAETGPESVPRFVGFIAAGISVDAMVAGAPAANLFQRTGLHVYDLGPIDRTGATGREDRVTLFAAGAGTAESHEHTSEVTFAGRRWQLGFSGVSAFRSPTQKFVTYGSLLGGIVLSVLAALLIQRLTSERRRLRALVAARATELRGVNAELRHRLEEVHEANHAKSQFLASVSHELRTPLNAIMGFSEMLKSEVFGTVGSAKNREYVDDIHEAGKRLLAQVNQLLDLSRIEAGGWDLTDSEIDVQAAAQSCRQLVTHLTHGAGPDAHQADVRVEVARGLPYLRADRDALDQILLNLASNAVKFSPTGAPVRIVADLADDGGIRLAVVDQGPGIPLFHQAKILEPFYQVADQHSRATEGSGLGLAIVDRLARAHGARLTIDSAPGSGTRMHLHFPPERSRVRAARHVARRAAAS
ncbi:MAG: CHASE domain-containing protein [Rhodovibrio sp.]|nr:CHASE domain-containing protein [Rhodovibrio sp.]